MVAIDRAVAPGSPGMFDLGEGSRRGGIFRSRVCDDLAGAAAALAMLDDLSRRKPAAPVAVLLTRAEEEGFIGCVAVCEHRTLLKKTDRVIAIECSARQPFARQGDGVIIRVGDRTSIFNSSLTEFLTRTAADVKKRDKKFAYQRALMPGGTCEATVYDIWGYHAASLCVPLGNYHNMNRARKTLGPEFINIADWENMVKLFIEIARTGHTYKPGHLIVRKRILDRYKKMEPLLMS
jgi:endoglucanase